MLPFEALLQRNLKVFASPFLFFAFSLRVNVQICRMMFGSFIFSLCSDFFDSIFEFGSLKRASLLQSYCLFEFSLFFKMNVVQTHNIKIPRLLQPVRLEAFYRLLQYFINKLMVNQDYSTYRLSSLKIIYVFLQLKMTEKYVHVLDLLVLTDSKRKQFNQSIPSLCLFLETMYRYFLFGVFIN